MTDESLGREVDGEDVETDIWSSACLDADPGPQGQKHSDVIYKTALNTDDDGDTGGVFP